jgi:hypothetical protein
LGGQVRAIIAIWAIALAHAEAASLIDHHRT